MPLACRGRLALMRGIFDRTAVRDELSTGEGTDSSGGAADPCSDGGVDTPEIRPLKALREEGWTRKDLRDALDTGALERVRRGRFATTGKRSPLEVHILTTVAVWQARSPDHVVSHTSAAVLHGLPVRVGALREVHLTRWSTTSGKLVAGVRLHKARVPEDQVVSRHGVRVTSLERTLADLGRWEPYEWGVVAADAAVRAGADLGVLNDVVARGRRKRNNDRLRRVLAFADPGAESAAESMSRISIARAGLPAPVLQFEVTYPDAGGWAATCDFGWPEHGLVGEVDGKLKYVDDARRGRAAADVVMDEKARDAIIVSCDYLPTHWGWSMAVDHRALGRHLRTVFASLGFSV